MITMKKGNANSGPVSREKALKMLDEGWEVYINKSGKKLVAKKEELKKEVKKEVKKEIKKK